ncbi:MAG: HEAT repeat domain-containing protein [Caldilineaceae bacterium]|nr:HEAT repeat domain-containing protein [Caldilineaceae bacterium]
MTTKTTITVADLMARMATDPNFPTIQEFSALSDLTLHDQAIVRREWMTIPEERRYMAVREIISASETELSLLLGRFLRAVLGDESSRIRAMAVAGLWEEIDENLIGPLVDLLYNDHSEEVRAAAAEALGPYVLAGEVDEIDPAQAMRVEEALLAVVHSDVEPLNVQCRALESIAYSGETGVRQLIDDAYYSPDEEMRVAALNAMARSADIRWRDAAQAELVSPDAVMRAAAARACGELEHREALPDLFNLLADDEKEVRLAAIFALGHLGGKDAIEVLTAAATSEDAEEAQAAEDALEASLFYTGTDIPLFDESDTEWDEELDDDW